MTVAVAMGMYRCFCSCLGIEKEMRVEDLAAVEAHEAAPEQQHPTDSQRTQTLDLPESSREKYSRRLQTPGDCCQCQDIAGQVRQAVPCICNHGL